VSYTFKEVRGFAAWTAVEAASKSEIMIVFFIVEKYFGGKDTKFLSTFNTKL
jgi:hypothetical protein